MTQHPEHILIILVAAWALYSVYCLIFCPHTVIDANDGDGIKIRIRLIQFWITIIQKLRGYSWDAPESDQPYGPISKKALKNLLLGKPIRIRKIDTSHDRWVCKIYLYGFIDVGAVMVLFGHAHNYPQYGNLYQWHEDFAKGAWCWGWIKFGLWRQNPKDIIVPEVWRATHKHKEGQSAKVVKLPASKKAKRK